MKRDLSTVRVTVAIPAYRGRRWIRRCLDSVLASTGIRLRVVVFDNASSDGTRDIVEREYPEVELIKSPRNVGFARANNRVIHRAISRGDDFAFLLNEDARVDPDTIVGLVKVARDLDVAVLSPLQYNYEGTEFEADFSSLLRQAGLRKTSKTPDAAEGWMKSDFVPTIRIIGAAVLMRLSTLRRVGLFDPIYFLYAEEEDLCRRVLRHGYKVGVTPKARIYHGHESTGDFMTLERMRRFNIIRGKYILVLKNAQQPLGRAMLSLFAMTARDIRDLFVSHRLGLAWEFALAAVQVTSLLGRIRRRRKLERTLASELWTHREMGTGNGSGELLWR